MHPLIHLFSQLVIWPFILIHAFDDSFIQSVIRSLNLMSHSVHVTLSLVHRFIHSFIQFISSRSYSADDSGAKRKYRELKRLPADIRAQVALLKVRYFACTLLRIPPLPPWATFQPLLGNACRLWTGQPGIILGFPLS